MAILLDRAATHSLVLMVQSLVLELLILFVDTAAMVVHGALRAQAHINSVVM